MLLHEKLQNDFPELDVPPSTVDKFGGIDYEIVLLLHKETRQKFASVALSFENGEPCVAVSNESDFKENDKLKESTKEWFMVYSTYRLRLLNNMTKISFNRLNARTASIPIELLNLGKRTYHSLKRNNFNTVGEIAQLSIIELSSLPQMGIKSVQEVIDSLNKIGLEIPNS